MTIPVNQMSYHQELYSDGTLITTGKAEFSTTGLASGLYFIMLKSADGIAVEKLEIIR